jgi:putrescine:ornithine antiporter
MAIAYGFARAGLFNQREGGMSAYAEDAYGKSGYFMVFYLYFISLAIGNVAIGSPPSAILPGSFPGSPPHRLRPASVSSACCG